MNTPEIDIVSKWHAALNGGDVDALIGLSSTEIEVGGPRGSATGVQMLREWVERASIRMEPVRTFSRGAAVVVEQDAAWHDPASGDVIGNDLVSSVFVVEDGAVASVYRYPSLDAALDAAGLTPADEV